MKIETDRAHFLSGVHHGKTIGSPDRGGARESRLQNWKGRCRWRRVIRRSTSAWRRHAPAMPIAGALKYDFTEARYVWNAPRRPGRIAAQGAIGALANCCVPQWAWKFESCDCGGAVSIADQRNRDGSKSALSPQNRCCWLAPTPMRAAHEGRSR